MKAKLLLSCFAVLLAAGTALAQQPPQAPGPDPVGENLFPPELIMSHQEAISLAPEQKSYIRDEIRKAQLRFTDLQWQLQDSMETLGSLLRQNPADEQAVLAQLDKVLDTLEADHDYLTDGGVFTPDLIETWLDYKRSSELDPIRLRPHPHEFELYFDI